MKQGYDLRAAVQEEEEGGGGGGEGGRGGESTWVCLTRPDGVGSSKKNGTVRLPGITQTRVHAAQDELKLHALSYSRQKGAKWEGVERQRCSVSTRKPSGLGN